MATIPTLEEMREAIAQLAGVAPAEVADDANLMDLGLDSIRAMSLIQRWANAGAVVDFAEFAEEPTLRHWWTVMTRTRDKPNDVAFVAARRFGRGHTAG